MAVTREMDERDFLNFVIDIVASFTVDQVPAVPVESSHATHRTSNFAIFDNYNKIIAAIKTSTEPRDNSKQCPRKSRSHPPCYHALYGQHQEAKSVVHLVVFLLGGCNTTR